MKLNDILETINTSLDYQRSYRQIYAEGHFVTHAEVKKLIGNYRDVTVYIDFFNGELTLPVVKVNHKMQGDNIEEVELTALQYLINILTNGKGPLEYKQFLEGSYAGIEG